MYIIAGLLVWPRSAGSTETESGFGLLGERGARAVWAALWLGVAALWLFPANAGAGSLRSAFDAAPSGVSWLSSLHSAAASAVGGSGMTITLALAVVSAAIGLSVLWPHGTPGALLSAMRRETPRTRPTIQGRRLAALDGKVSTAAASLDVETVYYDQSWIVGSSPSITQRSSDMFINQRLPRRRALPLLAVSATLALAGGFAINAAGASARMVNAQHERSRNWAGYVVQSKTGQSLSTVSGSWTAPSVSAIASRPGSRSAARRLRCRCRTRRPANLSARRYR